MSTQSSNTHLRNALTTVAQTATIKQLRGRKFPIEENEFNGSLWGVEPEKRLTVGFLDFTLDNDLLIVKIKIQSRFELAGDLLFGGAKVAVTMQADIDATLAADVKLLLEDEQFFAQPYVHEIEAMVTIVELTPTALGGGQAFASKLLNVAFQKRKNAIVQQINQSLEKYPVNI